MSEPKAVFGFGAGFLVGIAFAFFFGLAMDTGDIQRKEACKAAINEAASKAILSAVCR